MRLVPSSLGSVPLMIGLAIALAGPSGCSKKDKKASEPVAPTPPADAAPTAPRGLVLSGRGLGGVHGKTPGTLAAMRAALPGEELREAEIVGEEDSTSRGFELVRGGEAVAQIVLDDAGAVSFIEVTGTLAAAAAGAPAPIVSSEGIAAGASVAEVRKAGAKRCYVVKTDGDQIDAWPDAACVSADGSLRYEIELDGDAPRPTKTGPVTDLPGKVSRILWFADPKQVESILPQ